MVDARDRMGEWYRATVRRTSFSAKEVSTPTHGRPFEGYPMPVLGAIRLLLSTFGGNCQCVLIFDFR